MGRRRPETKDHPILEHPGDSPALIEPATLYAKHERIPDGCVLCFFRDVINERADAGELEVITSLLGEGEPTPVYRIEVDGEALALVWPGIGAPFAASILEELIALGGRRFICASGAGVLDGEIPVGRVIIPTAALREEGTSYHYQRRGRFSRPHPQAVRALKAVCRERGVDWIAGPTWTTDGVYRETPAKIRARRAEGCLSVEMEASAFFAVARFRRVILGQILYAGDDVSGDRWRHRGWLDQLEARRKLLDLALATCRRLSSSVQ